MITDEAQARAWLAARPEGTPEAFDRLETLIAMLAQENTVQNLVAAASLEHVWQRHIIDSAQLLAHVPRETLANANLGPWLDLGTGAGFPGLVIAALCPNVPVVMVESRARRIEWLNRVIEALGLRRASVEGRRLELVETRIARVISARAFAPLDRLVTLSARFSTKDTLWLLPKGRMAAKEVEELPRGIKHMFHVEPSLTDAESGMIAGHLLHVGNLKPKKTPSGQR
ncbi:16S rRNA (guanine(527)-N(7))-methyltransferase RsmG [Novosphingobium sp. FSY-8]|uniref:Ribosomal RNA small subunit methyltransferase G n=1 Tax=Novosphingobium ovatum TaxID=1908523 RepID=A0ABW9XHV1_9SPHN|nr:16S rRNA (guanine(527)-N(7))-methyltransferase RsmG [Novosphingobium ovatum]NBC37967.1 16S rRNA (guanine(527)-N(7))-methyltransferase RsmG [Novosphingobium ovatum]